MLKEEAVCPSETLVTPKSTRHHNPEDHNQHLNRFENVKFQIYEANV
jgi:hypothetical protein